MRVKGVLYLKVLYNAISICGFFLYTSHCLMGIGVQNLMFIDIFVYLHSFVHPPPPVSIDNECGFKNHSWAMPG